MIRQKSTAKIATGDDGVDVFYWHNYTPGMNKPTIVMHPGGGFNHSSYLPLEKALNEKGYPTLIVEPRGVGYSQAPSKPEFYTLEAYSKDLQKIVEQEGLEKPSFFAHSFGFMPTVDYVARTQNAKDITGACVSNNFAKTTFKGGTWAFGNLLPITDCLSSLFCYGVHKLKGEVRPDYPDQSNLEGKGASSYLFAINDIPLKQVLNHFLTNRGITSWDVSEQLGKIKTPIHLIHGSKDFMVMPFAAEMIKELAAGQVTSDKLDLDHTIPYKAPKMVADIIERYV